MRVWAGLSLALPGLLSLGPRRLGFAHTCWCEAVLTVDDEYTALRTVVLLLHVFQACASHM